MAVITFNNNKVNTIGDLPGVGKKAPNFILTRIDLSDVTLESFTRKKIIMNIFPSLDTPVCAMSIRKFNESANELENTVVLTISKDLPFAHARFCESEGLKNVIPLSEMRYESFGKEYGVRISDSPLAGLFSRAVVVIDNEGIVVHTEQVSDISHEPDYDAAIKAVKM